jgi:energy-coupling factor transport system permease protein
VGGVRLWALILVFGAFNAVVDHYSLLRRTPRMLFHAGLATTIALAFVPQVIMQLGAIRDAQRIRGHRFRSWRDGLPLVVPLLSGGLERSIQLAEAMDARGYGRTAPADGTHRLEIVLIGGLTLLALGLYFGFTGDARGWLAVGAALLLVGAVLYRYGAAVSRTRYLRERWRGRDTIAALASLVLLVALTWLRLERAGGLLYTPLPRVTLPAFEPATGALLLLLSVPALLELIRPEGADESRVQHPALADRA